MKDLVTHIIKPLVTKPDVIRVSEIEEPDRYLIRVLVDSHDLSRVIGSEGRIFRALRALVTLTSPHKNTDLVVDIAE